MVLHCVGCWPKVLPQGMSLCNGFGLCVGSSAMIQCINCRHSWPLFGLIPSHQSPYFRRRKWHLLRVIMRLHRQQQHRHRKQKQTATAETTPTPTYIHTHSSTTDHPCHCFCAPTHSICRMMIFLCLPPNVQASKSLISQNKCSQKTVFTPLPRYYFVFIPVLLIPKTLLTESNRIPRFANMLPQPHHVAEIREPYCLS